MKTLAVLIITPIVALFAISLNYAIAEEQERRNTKETSND